MAGPSRPHHFQGAIGVCLPLLGDVLRILIYGSGGRVPRPDQGRGRKSAAFEVREIACHEYRLVDVSENVTSPGRLRRWGCGPAIGTCRTWRRLRGPWRRRRCEPIDGRRRDCGSRRWFGRQPWGRRRRHRRNLHRLELIHELIHELALWNYLWGRWGPRYGLFGGNRDGRSIDAKIAESPLVLDFGYESHIKEFLRLRRFAALILAIHGSARPGIGEVSARNLSTPSRRPHKLSTRQRTRSLSMSDYASQ